MRGLYIAPFSIIVVVSIGQNESFGNLTLASFGIGKSFR